MTHRRLQFIVILTATFTVAYLIAAFSVAPRHCAVAAQTTNAARLNVLLIAVDDLRAIGGSYGTTYVKTPNIDALARRGTLFNRAYSQQALCSPSRTSVLTGLRPDSTRVYDLNKHFRDTIPDVVTLPQHFKQHGYHTQGVGKIYHNGKDDPRSWSQAHWMPEGPNVATGTTKGRGQPFEASPLNDRQLPDGQVAERALQLLGELKDKPFFLAVGFSKPHLPFIAPQKYFDLYPPATIKLPPNNTPPRDVPQAALGWGEMRSYEGIPKTGDVVPDEKARELIRGYYAATSFMDAQVGRVLAELDRLGLREKTIVLLFSDHGFSLMEDGMWTKHSNFETVLRVPLIVSVPGQKPVGTKTDALVELVDIYPTLVAAARLPLPKELEGTSLLPLVENPQRQWKQAAFSQFAHLPGRGTEQTRRLGAPYTIRTGRYRYVEYTTSADRELYDFEQDPLGTINIARRPEMAATVASLSKTLKAGWRGALPTAGAARGRAAGGKR